MNKTAVRVYLAGNRTGSGFGEKQYCEAVTAPCTFDPFLLRLKHPKIIILLETCLMDLGSGTQIN